MRYRGGVDEKGLLCPDPTGTDRHDRGEALRRLHQQHVAGRLLDPKRAEHEPDRREATPTSELPGDSSAEPPRRSADDGECLADTLPELGDVGSDPDAEGDDTEGEDAERDLGDGLVPEKPREVEARQCRSTSRLGRTPCVTAQEAQPAEHVDHREHGLRLTSVVSTP